MGGIIANPQNTHDSVELKTHLAEHINIDIPEWKQGMYGSTERREWSPLLDKSITEHAHCQMNSQEYQGFYYLHEP